MGDRSLRSTIDERTTAIIEAALSLAIEGGFDNVRQREVAARAGVTLRTLYRKFPSKDELLAMGVLRAADELERKIAARPAGDESAQARLVHVFAVLTSVFCGQPNLGRAVIRALAAGAMRAGNPVLAYEKRIDALVLDALRGRGASGEASTHEREIAKLLVAVWFSGVFGWAAGIEDAESLGPTMEIAIRHLVQ